MSVKSNTCDQTQKGNPFWAKVGLANVGLGLGCLSETNILAYYVPVNFVFNLAFRLGRRTCFSKKNFAEPLHVNLFF